MRVNHITTASGDIYRTTRLIVPSWFGVDKINLGSDREMEELDGLARDGKSPLVYTGPEDGVSFDPRQTGWLRKGMLAGFKTLRRLEVHGRQNIPQTGRVIVCANHPSSLDGGVMHAVFADADLRIMAAKEQFDGKVGKAMTALGCFPVDRRQSDDPEKQNELDGSRRASSNHAVGLVKEDTVLGIFPEGTIHRDKTQVGPLEDGVPVIARRAKADCISTMSIAYVPDTQPRYLEKGAGLVLAGAAMALGLAAAASGRPWLCGVASTVVLGLAGAGIGADFGARQVDNTYWSPTPKIAAAADRGALGWLIGSGLGLGGSVAASLAGAGPAGQVLAAVGAIAGGLSILAGAEAFIHRPVARVVIPDPIDVKKVTEGVPGRQKSEVLKQAVASSLQQALDQALARGPEGNLGPGQ